MDINTDNVASYKTALVSTAHLFAEDKALLSRLVEDKHWFIHRAGDADESGYIARLGLLSEDPKELAWLIGDFGFSEVFVTLFMALHDADYQAVHFDVDADLLPGAVWYTDKEAKVIPLAYDIPLMLWHDLNDEQKQRAADEFLPDDAESAEGYFTADGDNFIEVEGQLYNVSAQVMRNGDDPMVEHGFIGNIPESAFSVLYVGLCEDNDFVNVVRVMS